MPRQAPIADPILLKSSLQKDEILYAFGQSKGKKQTQEDAYAQYLSECFVLADGSSQKNHGDIAATLAADTAIWGYKHIRLRPYYWADKKLFMKRIFRSVNISLWQKQREHEYQDGFSTTLSVLMIGSRTLWYGSVGDTMGIFVHNGLGHVMTKQDRSPVGDVSKLVGVSRYGLLPQFATYAFGYNDIVILVTDGISDVLSYEKIGTYFFDAQTTDELQSGISSLLKDAEQSGSKENMSACVVKRINVDRM